jgi:hypothetical protein
MQQLTWVFQQLLQVILLITLSVENGVGSPSCFQQFLVVLLLLLMRY